ncbi:MAG: PIN domain-containing protein [Acidobacteria bacterium]|nr:PIN domain-containing protein [Acidobacteriota bacterium]
MPDRFVDTNILLYAAASSPPEARKRDAAIRTLTESGLVVSVQVLQEFYHQATRPTRKSRLSPAEALAFLEPILEFRVQPMTVGIFHDAVRLSRRYGIGYWDGAILAAAHICNCAEVYSEDLSHHQDYDGVRVINPFAEPPSS